MYQFLDEHKSTPDIHLDSETTMKIDQNTSQIRITIPSEHHSILPQVVLIQATGDHHPQDSFVCLQDLHVYGIRNKNEVSKLFPLACLSPFQEQQQETLELYLTTLLREIDSVVTSP